MKSAEEDKPENTVYHSSATKARNTKTESPTVVKIGCATRNAVARAFIGSFDLEGFSILFDAAS